MQVEGVSVFFVESEIPVVVSFAHIGVALVKLVMFRSLMKLLLRGRMRRWILADKLSV